METIGLELRLLAPSQWDGKTRASLRSGGRVLGVLRWPAALSAAAQAFVRDNLFAERLGDARRAHHALFRGYGSLDDVGCVPAAERTRFLADKPSFLPEPPRALAEALDLEDLVAEFATALAALRTAPPGEDLVLVWLTGGDR